ncbi:hypothetical protein DESUT3_01040 [Desulfuromonas versatilis]|uniref:DUF304 domain-containing protein n=1 Tax=Desulfuromonas versatilis TaxID=2802975 RepID=A0ABM9SDQ6_9BACT|nr:hypothetical protein [Desulfuromonas versatilis]BCR03035.1 hypothetical protein DESUT3_01040 [Desulfuromonas versatilis]
MSFLEFIHRYMRVLDRVRSTKEWLSPSYFSEKPHVITLGFAKSSEVIQLDNNRFVHDVTEPLWGVLLWAGIAVFILAVGIIPGVWVLFSDFYGFGSDLPNNYEIWVIVICSLFILGMSLLALPPCILAFVYLFKRPKERLMIFDRENGTVTLPPRFWGEHEVVPFHELKVKRIRNLGSIVNFYVLAAFRPSDGQAIEFGLVQDNWKDWAFYCWYMDKSRPLPPGKVFDPYRERDEARRLSSRERQALAS